MKSYYSWLSPSKVEIPWQKVPPNYVLCIRSGLDDSEIIETNDHSLFRIKPAINTVQIYSQGGILTNYQGCNVALYQVPANCQEVGYSIFMEPHVIFLDALGHEVRNLRMLQGGFVLTPTIFDAPGKKNNFIFHKDIGMSDGAAIEASHIVIAKRVVFAPAYVQSRGLATPPPVPYEELTQSSS
jgi:hypothetical protein